MTKYRIIRDSYLGYEAQVKYWWCPIWLQINDWGGVNTSGTLEEAVQVAGSHRRGSLGKVVWSSDE